MSSFYFVSYYLTRDLSPLPNNQTFDKQIAGHKKGGRVRGVVGQQATLGKIKNIFLIYRSSSYTFVYSGASFKEYLKVLIDVLQDSSQGWCSMAAFRAILI